MAASKKCHLVHPCTVLSLKLGNCGLEAVCKPI